MPLNWLQNSDLVNLNINFKKLKTKLITNPDGLESNCLTFSHVPKTAGTSLESILSKNFLMSESVHINAPDLNKQPDLLTLKKNYPKLICGHHPIHGYIYQALPDLPLFHLTQLRDPIDRVISYYNYIHAKENHPLHIYARDNSITGFINNTPSPELSNGQAKRFSGFLHSEAPSEDALVSIAKETLSDCFSLVLTTCLFDEGLLLLKNRLNLKDIYYQRSNVSKKVIKRNDLSESELNLIKETNQADIKLFSWVKSRCLKLIKEELSQEQIDAYKANNIKWNQLIND